MTERSANAIHPRFIADLRRMLNHLYDPDELRRNRLFAALTTLARGSPSLLREALVRLIGELKPRPGLSPDADAWRVYRTLHHRFVEQFTQAEAAATLGVSIRQIRRQESQALRVLADLLWTRYDLQPHYADAPALSDEAEPAVLRTEEEAPADEPARQASASEAAPLAGELAWLGQSSPPETARITELVAAALRTVEPLLRELAVRVRLRLPADLPAVLVQAGPIRQTVLLMLLEAIRLAASGEVILEACAEPDQVTLTVRSAPASLTTAQAQPDKLAVARQIAELSGSRLETLTDGADAPFVVGDTPFVAHLHLRPAAQTTVLFIEDNPDTLQLYQRYLAGTGYAFVSATTDAQIADRLAEIAPQIIVLDVMLSGFDGWEVLGRLRTHPRTADTPVVMCSILPLEQLALNLGAAAFLQKPVSREALLAVLTHLREARGQQPCSAS